VIAKIIRFSVRPWWTVWALLDPAVGRSYGISIWSKLRILRRVWTICRQPQAASSFFEHVVVIQHLWRVPREVGGVVAEFGCFKGLSTASLSLACRLAGRRLIVFDSFAGLPPPQETVTNITSGKEVAYQAGQYFGSLDEVKSNVARFGDVSVCDFVPGFFADTLPARDEQYVLILEDADLPQSVRDVLRNAWRRLIPGGSFFCHEARDREVVDLFFDRAWWQEHIGEPAPGFIGSGLGLMIDLTPDWCGLGYTVRRVE
jgi:O-methyltransferase